jgi:hypothetical protein
MGLYIRQKEVYFMNWYDPRIYNGGYMPPPTDQPYQIVDPGSLQAPPTPFPGTPGTGVPPAPGGGGGGGCLGRAAQIRLKDGRILNVIVRFIGPTSIQAVPIGGGPTRILGLEEIVEMVCF